MKVLLVAAPYWEPHVSTLAIATLRPLLEAQGHQVDEIHASLLFPAPEPDVPRLVFDWNCQFAFGRRLADCSLDEYVDRMMKNLGNLLYQSGNLDPHGLITPVRGDVWADLGVDEGFIRADLRKRVLGADTCLERIAERAAAAGPFDVVCLSAMFTHQVAGAVLVARRLKQLWPEIKIALGGAVCQGEQADGVVATFPEIDAACHAEGESVIVPLCQALAGGGSLADVPGIAWRDGAAVRHNPSPPLIEDLDSLPFPDYRGFFEQLAASECVGATSGGDLYFETARGCWWGQKSLCTFCGLNAEGLSFRAKSPQRAFDEIRGLYERYPDAFLRAADNILDMKYLKTVFPRLRTLPRDPVHPLRLFFEIKSNLRAEHFEILAAGGAWEVQPGIESFSDSTLKLMRKGCTPLGQVQSIKWTQQAELVISYNLIVLNPGETTASFQEQLELLPFIEHLYPPNHVVKMALQRFSPYHWDPAQFGITDIRPDRSFRDVFPVDADPRFAYQFDFDHPMYHDAEHLRAVRSLKEAVKRWQAAWRPHLAYFVDEGDRLVIVDRRGGAESRTTLAGTSARLYLWLDQHRPRASMGEAFPSIPAPILDTLLLTWLHRRWICRVGDRYLAVLPRRGPALQAAVQPPGREAPRLQMV